MLDAIIYIIGNKRIYTIYTLYVIYDVILVYINLYKFMHISSGNISNIC